MRCSAPGLERPNSGPRACALGVRVRPLEEDELRCGLLKSGTRTRALGVRVGRALARGGLQPATSARVRPLKKQELRRGLLKRMCDTVAALLHGGRGPVTLALALALLGNLAAAQTPGPVLVITPSMRDAVSGAGGTLAQMASEGRAVYIAVFGNEEKESAGLDAAATRLGANAEGERAAKILGAREVINLGHKSGELAMLSSSELRNQVMTLTRLYQPEILFFPDWYVHYQDDNDIYRVGRMAEESPYGGSSMFLQELSYLGKRGFAARQYYFFVPYRPYRAREGGEGPATMKQVDIAPVMARKLEAILACATANERWAADVRRRSGRAALATPDLVRAFTEELAAAVGARHGLRFAEEFNHLRPRPGLPEHVREKTRKKAP